MKKNELGKEIDAYKQKTNLFPHPEIVCKKKKRKNIKSSPQKER